MTRPTTGSSTGRTLLGPTRADSVRRSWNVDTVTSGPGSPSMKAQLGRAVFSPVGATSR